MKHFQALLNITSIFTTIIKRLRHYWSLSLSVELGIISVLSLIICVPVFTNAVLSQVLKDELNEKSVKYHRSIFSVHAYYLDNTLYTPLAYQNARYVSQRLTQQLTQSLKVKIKGEYLEASTKPILWKPVSYSASKPPFSDIALSIEANDFVPLKTRLVEGVWPEYDPGLQTIPDPLPVAIYEGFADEKYINVGDIYQAVNPNLSIKVVGIFRAIDSNDLDWFYNPETTFNAKAWVPDEFFQKYLPLILERPLDYTSWYAIVDEQSLHFENSLSYSHALARINNNLVNILPNIKVDYSPWDQLVAYESRMQSLITYFYIVVAPMVLLSLVFIGLTSSIAVRQLEQETVTIRGRGISLHLIFFQNIVESIFLILVALPFSILFGWFSATLIGQTSSFLQFNAHTHYDYLLKNIHWLWIGMLSIVIIIARFLPVYSLRHTTIVRVKQERARNIAKPVWQRYYFDFLLLFPTAYVYWRIHRQLSQLKPLTDQNPNMAQGQYEPMQFIASSLFIIILCMIALRIFPLLIRLFRMIIERGFPVGPYLAIQEISRRPQNYYNVIFLIMASISIAIFSSSIAKTFNQWMVDSHYYQTGADLVIREYEIPQNPGSPSVNGPSSSNNTNAVNPIESLIDLQKHLQIPDIQSATFVGKYNGSFTFGSGRNDCILMGIDRLSFPNTAHYRDDFSSLPLGELMNSLAEHPYGILVSQGFLTNSGLQVGDHLRVTAPIGLYKQGFDRDMVIVGAYKYFPTVFPAKIPTFIADTVTLFGYPEAATGYEVWINLYKNSNVDNLIKNLKSMALNDQLVVDVRGNAIQQIQKLTGQPEWLGLFGILSVGFLLTGILPCIGFILDSFAALRRNFIQFGILQAIGLSKLQMVTYLILERIVQVGVALLSGAGIGYITSILFVPLLQNTIAPGTPIPPFQVLIGWAQSSWLILSFAIIFLVAIIGTIGYMVQIKIFQAVKMGESI